jgi:hypothetical protein
MQRVLGILVSFLVCSACGLWVVVGSVGPSAFERGRSEYAYRARLDRVMTSAPRSHRLVAWVGDSTIWGRRAPSFPQLLRPSLRKVGGAGVVVAVPGFDAYAFYFVMGSILRMDPHVVVIVARLPAFHLKGTNQSISYNDLSSDIPLSALPRSFLLPLADRRLSPARIVLAQGLNVPAAERAFYTAEGLRFLYEDAPFWAPLGAPVPPKVFDGRVADELKRFDIPLTRRFPSVRMLGATVQMVTDAGRTAIVVGMPIPIDALRKRAWFDATVYAARFDALRAVVETAGGRFLDLHDLLPQDEFVDFAGHFNKQGAHHLAERIWPEVGLALGTTEEMQR